MTEVALTQWEANALLHALDNGPTVNSPSYDRLADKLRLAAGLGSADTLTATPVKALPGGLTSLGVRSLLTTRAFRSRDVIRKSGGFFGR